MKPRAIATCVAWVLGLTLAVTVARSAPPPAETALQRFAGAWELDLVRSDFGKGLSTRPLGRRDTIDAVAGELRVRSWIRKPHQTQHLVFRYLPGGAATVNTVEGQAVTSTARWRGSGLEIESRAKVLFIELSVDERWIIDRDQRLRMVRTSRSPLGTQKQTLVFVRV